MANTVTRVCKKLKTLYSDYNDPWWRAKKKYIKYYENLAIDPHIILLESEHGKKINGNIFYILKYLSGSEKYKDYNLYISARAQQKAAIQKTLDFYGITNANITILASEEYFQLLASAKFLINDTSFGPYFTKKSGQIYLNTWHGTPLKTLGRRMKSEPHTMANIQKNFVSADFILFPNEWTREAIINDYMLENISGGSYILGGYPRNEAFYSVSSKSEIIDALELEGKKIYAYMPTFRGLVSKGGTDKNTHYLNYYLYEIDKALSDNEVLYVNLHRLAKKDVQFKQFKHIRNFPAQYETYDFLNVADVLITDYSSVFFDFAISGRKIVLFVYDKEEYLQDRGMYLSMEELPFPQVTDLNGLLNELRSGKQYDDREFLAQFCKYENAHASQKLCDRVILGEDTGLEVCEIPNNGKENVLLYAGNLAGNGITTALRSLLNVIDLDKRNYYFSFFTEKVAKNAQTIFTFPENANCFAMTGEPNFTVCDLVIRKLFRKKLLSAETYMKLQGKRVRQGLERNLGGARFDKIVHFSGYEDDNTLAFSTFEGPKIIYVHNDMVQEIKTKGNQRWDVLHYAYNHYDCVAIVTEDIVDSTRKISGSGGNLEVAKNAVDYKSVLQKSTYDLSLRGVSRLSVQEDVFRKILDSNNECFINIGRFSPEKGHGRLVAAFKTYHLHHPDSYLFIMGGYSRYSSYEKLQQQIEELNLQDYVILLEKVSNPYPIIKACDYFVLSSYYEGLPIVLVEADILGLPIISTDIPGPRSFMKKYGGTLVENSENGIYQGMELLHVGGVKPMNVDYDAYNQEAAAEFEKIMER